MEWIEVIAVRTLAVERHALEKELAALVRAEEPGAGEIGIELFHHATLETDLTLHLHHTLEKVDPLGSELGRQLAETLTEYGRVYHSVWVQWAQDTGSS